MVIKLFRGKSALRKFVSENLLRSPQRMILLSFLLVIGLGTLALSLPQATRAAGALPWVDALFMATSATCVTGLAVTDMATFTTFGQWVILLLIQLGGLGIMTFSTFFMFLFIGRFNIYGRNLLIDTFTQNPILELGKLVRTVFSFTLALELIGCALLTVSFLRHYPLGQAFYYGLFHSISAFCNAGFSILENGYLNYASDAYFCMINILLIISGGLGFMVIFDIKAQLPHVRKGFVRRLSIHSKIVLMTSAFLVAFGTVAYLVLEWSYSLREHSWPSKLLIALFQSVTTRTAGFSTTVIDGLTMPMLFIMVLLMFIGASPGSCGGGIKTTTFALFVQSLIQQFWSNKDINIYERRIPESTLSRAISIVFFAIFTIGAFIFLLLLTEVHLYDHREISLMDVVFEVVSAFGTVGLSTGITPTLSPAGKLLITLLMYIGRLGPLTLVFALKSRAVSNLRYMKEDILVG